MKQTNTYILKNTNSALISKTLAAQLYDLNERLSKMDYLKVIDIIWFFNYSPEKAWEKNGLPENEYESSIGVVQRELMRMLKLMYPETWKSLTAAPANDAEKALSKALKSEITFGFVRDKISCFEISTVESFDRAIFLLTSDEEKNRFGGLKAIGFKKYEANFLKEVAPQISEVLREFIDVTSLKSEEPKLFNNSPAEKPKLFDNSPAIEPNLFDNSPAEKPKQLDISPVIEEVAQTTTAPTPENQLSLILDSQAELKELEKLYPIHCQYIKVLDTLLEKGFTMEELTKLIGIN